MVKQCSKCKGIKPLDEFSNNKNFKDGKSYRRNLGFKPLNTPFEGCEGHHLNQEDVVFIPKELHRSIFHRQRDGMGMEEINTAAMLWIATQEIIH